MRNLICKAAAACALFGVSAGAALAGDWEVWTQKQGGDRLTIVASFAGDGVTEEAHLDLKVAARAVRLVKVLAGKDEVAEAVED